MIGLVVPVCLALLAALALGGSLDGLGRVHLRWSPLAILALSVQIPLYSPPFNTWAPVVAIGAASGILTTGLVLLMVIRNAAGPARPACVLAALGIALNLTVMLANGGWMPRVDAVAAHPIDRGDPASTVNNTVPMATETRLGWLGDTIAQPDWLPMANVVSPGDLLLSIGAAWWIFQVTRRRSNHAV
jgi:Family of unknown function (DUF5317)